MATNTGAFFVGVGTTFAILAIGFGGGLMMAKTAVEPRAEQQARAPRESSQPVRVILPASAEPAQSPQPSTTTVVAPPPPIKQVAASETTLEKVDTRKAEAEERERKRYAERKARRLAERAKRKQRIEQGEHRNPPVMAFGGDEPRQGVGSGFFGN